MPTNEETAFMADPKSFMEDNMFRVVCSQKTAGQYAFSLVSNANVPSKRKNRRGRAIQYFELTEDASGAMQMWFLPYEYADVRESTLPTNGTDLMVTVQLNGC